MPIVKAYAVREIGWQYNDENYYREGCGETEKVFFNKIRAENFCRDKNIEMFKTASIGEYIQEYDLYKNRLKRINRALNQKYSSIEDFVFDKSQNVIPLNDLQAEELMRIFSDIIFYEMVSVDVDLEL